MTPSRARILRRAAELVVATHAITSTSCRRPDYETEHPHQASDPVAPPCRVEAATHRIKGYWLILDGVRGVLLEPPLDVDALGVEASTRRALGGTFVPLDEPVLRLRAQPLGPNCPLGPREVVLPPDGAFDVEVR